MLEGTRRLGLILGLLGGAMGMLFGLIIWSEAREPGLPEGLFLLLLPLLCFFIPWYTIRVVSWVIEGFVTDWGNRRAKKLPGGTPTIAEQFCTSCGKPISKDAVFCQQCGVKVDDESTAAPFEWSEEDVEEVAEETEESDSKDVIEDRGSMPDASPRTTFCTSCGKEIDNAFWCHHCGAVQKGSTPTRKYTTPPTRQKDITPPTASMHVYSFLIRLIESDRSGSILSIFWLLFVVGAAYWGSVEAEVESSARVSWIVGWFVAYGAAFVVGLFPFLLVVGVVIRLYDRVLEPRGVSAYPPTFAALLIGVFAWVWVILSLGRYLHDIGMEWFLGS
jgi:predicted RNA-binding Zn-ribbon protein involved in translation (DUF1610 family)